MKIVRTHFLPDQKNKSVYFDYEETLRHFNEDYNPDEETPNRKEYFRCWTLLINSAYDDGFEDGVAATIEKAKRELENGKVD